MRDAARVEAWSHTSAILAAHGIRYNPTETAQSKGDSDALPAPHTVLLALVPKANWPKKYKHGK